MLIVDSQVHLQTAGKATPYHRQDLFLTSDVLKAMDAAGVDRAVLIPPSWDPNLNGPALEAARRHPGRFAVMGRLLVEQPESRSLIGDWKQQPGMLGIRLIFGYRPTETWRKGGAADWLWPAAERAGIPIMLHVGSYLSVVEGIAQRHPGLRLVVDHLGAALTDSGKDAAAYAHLPEVLKLARFPNVAVKASGVPTYSSEPYPFPGMHRYLRQVFDAFGPERMFWGTDLSRLTYWGSDTAPKTCSYRQAVTLFTEELPWLSARDKELIMGCALCDWIGWKLSA